MPAEIINPFKLVKPLKYTSGEASCRRCQHTWDAFVPEGTTQIECPECKTMCGAFRWPFGTNQGEEGYHCNCGCEDFFIMRRPGQANGAVYCRGCGLEALGWFE